MQGSRDKKSTSRLSSDLLELEFEMNSKFIALIIAALFVLPLTACDSKKTDEKGDEAKAEGAAEKEGDEKAEKEEKKEEKEESGMTVDQFASKLTPTACKAIDQCKNEEVKSATSTMLLFAASMAAMQDKEMQKKLKPISDTLEKEKRFFLKEDECNTVFGSFTGETGMDGETLKAKVGKTIEFDAEKAQACLDNMMSVKACEKEVKLEKELKMKDMEKVMKDAKLEDALKPCQTAIVGKVAEGENCDYEYECKGDDVKCSAPKDAKPKEGEEPQKTCQKKQAPGGGGGGGK
jgi:hypothetical protein